MPRILIIGAGVAGASAAAVLADAGWTVQLLDKADKPGGRCATRRLDAAAGSPWFDYGAQYFTARDEAFRAVVDADLASGHLRRWQPTICLAERGNGAWQVTPSPDTRERLIAPTGLNHWVRHRLQESLANVYCNTRVAAARHEPTGWRLDCETDPTPREADALLITTPAPQTAALLGRLAAGIAPLSGADRALRACHSLVVEAPALPECHGLFVKGGALSWIADNSHKAGRDAADRHLWTLHAGPDFSDAHVEHGTADVQAKLIDEFAAITGIAPSEVAPVRGHRWRYARPGDGAPETGTLCYADQARRLALAGDWLVGGRVEGAWLSGRSAAQALLDG